MEDTKISLPVEWQDWKVVRLLGRGSCGAVYEIQRDLFGDVEKAALKVVSIPQNRSEIRELESNNYDPQSITAHFRSHLEVLVKEYSLMKEMKGHTNIVYCDDLKYIQHDSGMGWNVYIKMELLTPLTEYLPRQIQEDQVLKLGMDICSALIHCGKRNIIHRDIKPQNIFVSADGSYKLGDFGIAKVVENASSGTKAGTYNYMAPEVYKSEPYGAAADQYSLGLVLYWMLNERRLPFLPLPPQTPTVQQGDEARQRRMRGEPISAPLNGSEGLQKIVLKACAYDPKDRFASIEEMLLALEGVGNETVGFFYRKDAWERLKEAEAKKEKEKEEAEQRAREQAERERQRLEEEARLKELELRRLEEEARERQRLEEERKKRKRRLLLIGGIVLALAVLVVCFFTVHFWSDATCTEPSQCSLCGKVRQAALGHSWTEGSCTEDRICLNCGSVGTKASGHNWENATCTSPRVCRDCGYAEGTAMGHSWESATCTTPLTCTVCTATEGTALGHSWVDATYDAPRTCLGCGLTEGSALGYSLTRCSVLGDSNEIGGDVESGSWKDASGNYYADSVKFWVKDMDGWSNTEHIVYALSGKYTRLELTMAAAEDNAQGARVMFLVYGDDVLLYDSSWADNSTWAFTCEIDVTGVNQLKVECFTDSAADAYGLAAGMLYTG